MTTFKQNKRDRYTNPRQICENCNPQIPDFFKKSGILFLTTKIKAFITNIQAIATNVKAVVTNIQAIATNIKAVVTNIQAIATNIKAVVTNALTFVTNNKLWLLTLKRS